MIGCCRDSCASMFRGPRSAPGSALPWSRPSATCTKPPCGWKNCSPACVSRFPSHRQGETMRFPRFLLALPLFALSLVAQPAPAHVDNFALLDQQGKSRELYYLSDKQAVVIMVQGNGCPITRNAWQALREVRAAYAAKGVEFLMLNSNLQDDRDSIRAEAGEFGYDI